VVAARAPRLGQMRNGMFEEHREEAP